MQIASLDHVALHVADVVISEGFYRQVLGLESLSRPAFDFPGAWLRIGSSQQLHLIGGRSEAVSSHSRGTHFAVRVDDLDAWARQLRIQEADFSGPHRRPDGWRQIFVIDPDGHYVELNQPPSPGA